jgi:hypothetical protein
MYTTHLESSDIAFLEGCPTLGVIHFCTAQMELHEPYPVIAKLICIQQ